MVAELNQTHIGKRLRVQSFDGGFIEGTLAKVKHELKEPYGKFIETWLAFEEFTVKQGRDMIYIPFMTIGNRSAREIDE
jgi:hypothetical protein